MKKFSTAVKELLESERGTLEINSAFRLRRWTLNPETDDLGRHGDFLELEMYGVEPLYEPLPKEIKSRKYSEIVDEVAEGMDEMFRFSTERMIKRWKGGIR